MKVMNSEYTVVRGFLFAMTFFILPLVSTAHAQSRSDRFLQMDPNIIAAANCSGAVFAVSMSNFEGNILNEERARAMLRTVTGSLLLVAIKHQSIEHLVEFQEDYDAFFTGSYETTYNNIVNGNYNWDSQEQIDVCTANVFMPFINVTAEDLQRLGVDSYFQFISAISAEADKRFDFMLRLMDSMR